MRPDGSDERRVGDDLWIGLGGPGWSPDGLRIAVGTSEGLVVVDVMTGETVTVADGGGGASWSPDGQRIAFTARNGEPGSGESVRSVYIANADGTGEPVRLVEGSSPAWRAVR